jgi:hypothetical protein
MYLPCTNIHSGPHTDIWHPGSLFPNTGSEPHLLAADLNQTAFATTNSGPGDRTVRFTGSELCLPAAVST